MLAAAQSVTELATIRQAILERPFVNEATDMTNFAELLGVENQIEVATFNTNAEVLAGFRILFELNDAPVFADQFKAKLFSRMHEFI